VNGEHEIDGRAFHSDDAVAVAVVVSVSVAVVAVIGAPSMNSFAV
jgi:hypothetical protein